MRVDSSPGVDLLLSIGAWQPEFLLTGQTLRDQGLMVSGLMSAGWRREHLRQVIAGRPLPDQLHRTVGAIVSGRLKAAAAMPVPSPNAGGPMDGLVPHQSPAPDRAASGDQPRWESAPTPTPDRWEDVQEHQQQLRHGVERERGCEGDDGLCDRLAVVGETQCAEHLGWPLCPGHDGSSCARRTRDGGQCATCQGQEHYARMADALPEPESDNGRCPGYNAPCGRGITIVGLCPRCRIASQHDRDRIEKEWREAAAAAVAAAEAEEAAQGVPVPF